MKSAETLGLTDALVAFIHAPDFGADLDAGCDIARIGFVDSIATMCAGRGEEVVRILRQRVAQLQSDAADAPLLFGGGFAPTDKAALVNGTAAHALDFDDVALSAHVSTVLVPAILAEAHAMRASGERALEAYIVGYEVWAELVGRESDQYHVKGWHPTGVFGSVAAAASIAFLRGLAPPAVRNALGIAASMASGLVANFGSMTKPMHAGRAAASGIEAALLAEIGLTAAPDALEHPAGYLHALSPTGRVDLGPRSVLAPQRLKLLDNGLNVKQYPVCYGSHRIIDGMRDLVQQHGLRAQDVGSVRVTVGEAQAAMLRNHAPMSALEAKFSAEFAVACTLLHGGLTLADLDDTFVGSPEVHALMARVQVETTDSRCPLDPAFSFADRIGVECVDGRTLHSGNIRFPRGHAHLPLSSAGLEAKFHSCVDGYFDEKRDAGGATRLFERLWNLRRLEDVSQLLAHER